MKLKDFKIVLLLFFVTQVFSQYRLSGIVTDGSGKAINNVEIYNKKNGKSYLTDATGNFTILLEKPASYTFVFYGENFSLLEKEIQVLEKEIYVKIQLQELSKKLNEVVVVKQKKKLAAVKKLKDVEGTAIYAGKKTEVVQVSQLTANKATNNTRQIYAQVVGLTINESADGGLQLSIGGRGLDPNRTANFNTRQNGYDISADVLGYPESYYATPTEALEEVQIVRGAASLQYGTQFGGMVNFKTKTPSKKPLEAETRFSAGSYNFLSNYTSLSGTQGKFSYYTFLNYKQGDGFRPNAQYDAKTYFGNFNYKFNDKTSLHFDYTRFDYLAKQSGGLTDYMFYQNPRQSNRARNWFAVDWNLFALLLKHKFKNDEFSLQLFGLDASRKAIGFRTNRVSNPDNVPDTARDLIIGDFVNWGAEARYLSRYHLGKQKSVFLLGGKYYQSDNLGIQNAGSSGKDASFSVASSEFPLYPTQSAYKFPNLNVALFGENIFRLTENFSLTPGFRLEHIKTQAQGFYRRINLDLSGNVILDELKNENIVKQRNFLLLGLGLSYKPLSKIEVYGNVSQNYRSVTFNDIRTVASGQAVAEDITDEKGFTSDIGVRGKVNNFLTFDISAFGLYYDGKIAEYEAPNPNGFGSVVRLRDNVGTALTYGIESMLDFNLNELFLKNNPAIEWNWFSNISLTDSKYVDSAIQSIKGKKVEFVPFVNLKTGTGFGYKNFLSSVQLTYLTSQFTDAKNTVVDKNDNTYGVFGEIPAYYVVDFSTSYKWKKFKLEAGINNLTNNWYFTRRATGYPGPGIIPSEPRVFYGTLEFVF